MKLQNHIIRIFEAPGDNLADRFTVLVEYPDSLECYGMSEGGRSFNQYCGNDVEPGEHLGTEVAEIPDHLIAPITARLTTE